MQRADGSWPMKIVDGEAEDPRGEVNMSAYLAVGRLAPLAGPPRPAASCSGSGRRCGPGWTGWSHSSCPFGGIRVDPPTGGVRAAGRLARASTSRCAPGSRSPSCSTTRSRSGSSPAAGSATRSASTATCSRTRRPTRWTGTTRSSAAPVRGAAAHELLESRWDDFVVPGLGIRCVDTNPWVTGAETCELAMALDAIGDHRRALALLADMQHLREPGRPLLDRLGLRRPARTTASRATSTGRSSTRPTPRPR